MGNQMKVRRLEGNSWTKRTARIGFPILVEYARKRQTITYSGWDKEIVKRGLGQHVMSVLYGRPAGAIGDACKDYADQTGTKVPPINLLVVNEKLNLPGKGANEYIRRFCKDYLDRNVDPTKLSDRKKRAIIDRAHTEIFDFPSWGDVLRACGLKETKRSRKRSRSKRRHPNPGGWSSGSESNAHKRLKEQVANNPTVVGLKTDDSGIQEFTLWSGDRVDVYFQREAVAVEVKTASAGFDELHRGIFQCVKYKAVLRAQQVHDRIIPVADCLLAVGGVFPKELQEIANVLGVQYYAKLSK